MVCKTLFALCILTSGWRVQSLPTSAPLSVSLPANSMPPITIWTSSPQNTDADTASPSNGTHSNSVLPVTASAPTSLFPKNISTESREEEITSPGSNWEGTNTEPSPPGFSSTSSGVHLTTTSEEHSSGTPEAGVAATVSHSSAEPPTLISPQAPASSPSSLSTSPPEVFSASVTTNHSSTVTSTQPTGAPTASESSTEESNSNHTPTSHATAEPVPQEKTSPTTVSGKVMCELIDMETTTTFPRVIMQEVEHALSSGSIAAITVTVIAVVLLVFGVAAYLKIRHSSYGRLLDDHDYGSWGNYNNPLMLPAWLYKLESSFLAA
ncbi:prostate androgen-regulated mucin-like protein 1 isoform X1 [Rhinopithecus roxellana]|uniref:prostate androgen-regulated mucin-like protein 1 isoform X1 n=1 Tax=Rhinopithecus roxellana TaxID=61622 RepID=UPI00053334DF|nr:prostate androgen-regulated mucin-like protein 1 isoform X1 [Rhinopithecus roxellana]